MRKKCQKTVWTRSNVPNKCLDKTKSATNNEENAKTLAYSGEECPNLSKANLLFGLAVCPKTTRKETKPRSRPIESKPRAAPSAPKAVKENNKRKNEVDSEAANDQLSTSIEKEASTENSCSRTIITDQLRFEETVSNSSPLPESRQHANTGDCSEVQDKDKRDENGQNEDVVDEQESDLFLYESESDDELVVTIGDMRTTFASHRDVPEEPQQSTSPMASQPLPTTCNATTTYDPASISKSVSNPTLMTPMANIFVPCYIPVATLYAQSPIMEWQKRSAFSPQVPNLSKPPPLFPLLNNFPLAITYGSNGLSLPATIEHKLNIQQYEVQAETYVENREAGNLGRHGFHKRNRNFNTRLSKENYPDKPVQRYPPRPQAKDFSKNFAQNSSYFMEEKQSDVRYHNGRGRPTVNRHGFREHHTVNPSHMREGNKYTNSDKPPHMHQSPTFSNNHRYRPLSHKNPVYKNQQDRVKDDRYNREWDPHKRISSNNEQQDRSKFGNGRGIQITE
ncbi:hypothetical protein DdX_13362 [Ditylenchus destructor]|uniref:Uncharacterized protein n=1 Tax=Ditylenchus destructor TaxID=166010 RepID=A0AAD4MWB4_9BILA|nr:hypothetical protein DdX_13362 [Ditylenchus destructor]